MLSSRKSRKVFTFEWSTVKHNFALIFGICLTRPNVQLWSYGRGDRRTKCFMFGYESYWFKHPSTWFRIHTNGARKGIDKCFDSTVQFIIFYFTYTNFDYNR